MRFFEEIIMAYLTPETMRKPRKSMFKVVAVT